MGVSQHAEFDFDVRFARGDAHMLHPENTPEFNLKVALSPPGVLLVCYIQFSDFFATVGSPYYGFGVFWLTDRPTVTLEVTLGNARVGEGPWVWVGVGDGVSGGFSTR